jgi:hypothetical protein
MLSYRRKILNDHQPDSSDGHASTPSVQQGILELPLHPFSLWQLSGYQKEREIISITSISHMDFLLSYLYQVHKWSYTLVV